MAFYQNNIKQAGQLSPGDRYKLAAQDAETFEVLEVQEHDQFKVSCILAKSELTGETIPEYLFTHSFIYIQN